MTLVIASRNSRSWLITIIVPSKRCSQASSQTSASRSRWLVGSSSSSRSAGHISARASCRRMRQPPEKLLTGASSSALLKPRPEQQRLRARPRVEAAGVADRVVRLGHRVAVVGGLGARELRLRLHQPRVALRARSRSRPRRSRACPARPRRCASAAASRRRRRRTAGGPSSSENSVDLPAPLRPTRPTFSPGCSVTLARSSTSLAPRRSET